MILVCKKKNAELAFQKNKHFIPLYGNNRTLTPSPHYGVHSDRDKSYSTKDTLPLCSAVSAAQY